MSPGEKLGYRDSKDEDERDSDEEKNSEHSSDEEDGGDVLDAGGAESTDLDEVRRFLAARLGISVPGQGDDEQRQPQVLESFDLEVLFRVV